jgi:acyl-[acyl-carrier-protein]-phospholipid O-acyltransferase/long-chain-fatty-acid--[acyl-carrier-protein] ligase
LKRFSKISGEMISLTAVEDALAELAGERKQAAVMGVPDERKGEKLVIITNSPDLNVKSVRDALKSKGFSDLACPREVIFMREIPKLGTGKADYMKLKEIMEHRGTESGTDRI